MLPDALSGLPLTHATAPGWACAAMQDLDALLVDHAHCEHKAASTALRLINRFPDYQPMIRPLLALAAEEMRHFRQVLDLLDQRGIRLRRPEPDRYVNLLRRQFTSRGHGLGGLADHLLVAAFIEARSCERLRLLACHLQQLPHAGRQCSRLAVFYQRLAEAEGRHWELFHDLAAGCTDARRLQLRMRELSALEGAIVASLPHAPRMH